MCDVVAVEVLQTSDQLVEVSASNFFGESSTVRDVLEELTASAVLQYDTESLVLLSTLLRVDTVLNHLNEVHEVWVIHQLHHLYLLVQCLHVRSQTVSVLEDLHGNLLTVYRCELHLCPFKTESVEARNQASPIQM